jgi:hypothetical protein
MKLLKLFFADFALDELLDDRVGMAADIVGVAVGDYPAVMQHNNAVGYFIRAFHIVRYRQTGYAKLFLELQNKLVYYVGPNRVKPGCRLVIQYYFRVKRYGPGQCDAFSLASGKVGRVKVLKPVEADHFELVSHKLFDRAESGYLAVLPDGEHNVLCHA